MVGGEPAYQCTQAENNNKSPFSFIIAHTGYQSFLTRPCSDGKYAEVVVQ